MHFHFISGRNPVSHIIEKIDKLHNHGEDVLVDGIQFLSCGTITSSNPNLEDDIRLVINRMRPSDAITYSFTNITTNTIVLNTLRDIAENRYLPMICVYPFNKHVQNDVEYIRNILEKFKYPEQYILIGSYGHLKNTCESSDPELCRKWEDKIPVYIRDYSADGDMYYLADELCTLHRSSKNKISTIVCFR